MDEHCPICGWEFPPDWGTADTEGHIADCEAEAEDDEA